MCSYFGPVHEFKNLITEANYLLDAVLVVSRGASHFNFHSFQHFLIHLNTKMPAEKLLFCTQAGTHICCGFTVNDLIT